MCMFDTWNLWRKYVKKNQIVAKSMFFAYKTKDWLIEIEIDKLEYDKIKID